MKKEILYIWFGDVLPGYARPTIEHTRMMNPTWDVTLKHYTKEQLMNRESQGDNVLLTAYDDFLKASNTYRKTNPYQMSYDCLSINYRIQYVKEANHPIVYLDLDTVCIDQFDNYFVSESFAQGFVQNLFPTWRETETKQSYQNCNDVAVATNIKNMSFRLSSILKDIDLSKPIIHYNGMIMNEGQQAIYDRRSEEFHLNRIDYSKYEPITNPQLSPIEHYYSWERKHLKENTVVV